jgi:hypothetical protein
MDNLIIEHRMQLISRKVVGGLWIIVAVSSLILRKELLEARDWVRSIIFFILGIVFLTPLLGSTKSQIEICEGRLKIIWLNWLRTVTIQEIDIERIVLAKDSVKIYRNEEKAVKILLFYMGKEQKKQVYKFFTEYAQQKNILLGK